MHMKICDERLNLYTILTKYLIRNVMRLRNDLELLLQRCIYNTDLPFKL